MAETEKDSMRGPVWARARPWLLAALSGLLMSAAFPPLGLYWIAWVGLIPLLHAMDSPEPRVRRGSGVVFGVTFFGVGLHWLFAVFGVFAVAMIAIEAAFVWLFATLIGHLPAKWPPLTRAALTGVIWVGTEYLRSDLHPLKFGWLGLGYTQTPDLPLLQLAAVFGGYGISFLLAFGNATLYQALRERSFASVSSATGFALVVAVIHGSGWERAREVHDAPYTVVAIQDETFDVDGLMAITESLADVQPDLVVWPETAVQKLVYRDDALFEALSRTARNTGSMLVVGCKTPAEGVAHVPADRRWYNSALVFSREGAHLGTYRKHVPVQFMNDGLPGTESPSFPCHIGRLGVMICYDMDFPSVARSLVRNGADIIAVPTMDAAEWGRVQHLQHAAMTPMRAVETARFVVRAAGSGISQIVDPHGRETMRSGFEPGAFVGSAGIVWDTTPYVRWGYLFAPVCLAATGLVAAVAVGASVLRRCRARGAQPAEPESPDPSTT